ncbi:MAG: hypothetical protein JF603_08980 [Acidobacteria bacterium]|nr:hypothetical protein [Acidobacteriota bacterium]
MRQSSWAAMAMAGVLAAGLAGCGSDDTGGRSAGSATTAPEEKVSTGAELVAGLAAVKALAAGVPSLEGGEADRAVAALYTRWFRVEGTVRATDRDLYLDMEDQLAAIKGGVDDGDGDRVTAAAAELATVIDSYFAAHGATTGTTVAAGKRTPVAVALTDYRVTPEAASISSGVTTFDVTNRATQVHEMVVVRTDLPPADLPVDHDGNVDEKGSGVEFIDEVEDVKPGTSTQLSVDLPTGSYILLCNLPGHFKLGMYRQLEVTASAGR